MKIKAPCWVKSKKTGDVLRCRRVSVAGPRMKVENNWHGLVLHVQNEKGTGLMQYRDAKLATPSELENYKRLLRTARYALHRQEPQRCEKCNALTSYEVEVSGRWAAWCGCPN